MAYDKLRMAVCDANREISRVELAILTWGNASEVDREAGVFAIKPSGIDYEELKPGDIPLVSLETGEKIEGALNPSSDTATHWRLYQAFPSIGGIVHTHSPVATAWAQAKREIPCLGTTHADTFHGAVPCTRPLTEQEVAEAYELSTGDVIAAHFADGGLDPNALPGVLVACHAPFTWGKDAMSAVVHARILESVAQMAATTLRLSPGSEAVDPFLQDKHYFRKHGATATYGQSEKA
ncbi:MAG: L-ribulose-5-phosphate 4-epimerase AraD [Kiritimatiellia bacterium]|jgi:L-ribulose-5-phosphate 4-epimerase|nr:L-ribulose-5-phosphate 4-epimerase AraD [Kiritimatiellia bacterium]MDP6629707.1 L-ribulose-5-phosphate 4-epimerase AraD [Kiritimatiellia bacterium]MDP6810946.1 L-ribulose-5-phosphate 4-epimerase AraD [Kiritimatiellia bacterium]MDP7023251.1 L-ribulose-5-phosphate 4-epimerase AraD [Kiritimatiellia bacterium]